MKTKREIKNFSKAEKRIIKAIKKKENIFLYADSDLDGITSSLIFKETIEALGGKIKRVYFPKREEGYGITKKGINYFKKLKGGLFLCLDLGTTNQKEIEKIKKYNFEVIVFDHHNILEKIPKCIFINPKQKGDFYPFKFFATAGLVFKFSEKILPREIFENLKKRFLEFAMLGTIYDFMPVENENKEIIRQGIESIKNSFNPAIKLLLEQKKIKEIKDDFSKIKTMISILSAGKIKNHISESYIFLSKNKKKEARKILKILLERAKKRKIAINKIIQEVEKKEKNNQKIIFSFKKNWQIAFLGSASSFLCSKYKKPVFLLCQKNRRLMGSVRSPKRINVLDSLKNCAKFLEGWGGHPQAGGFRLSSKNLEKFKKCLFDWYEKRY